MNISHVFKQPCLRPAFAPDTVVADAVSKNYSRRAAAADIIRFMLTLAISRGRIWTEALPLLHALGLAPQAAALGTRQLIIPTANPQVRLLQVRAQDAPAFVACGAAQAGIAGRDVLAEKRMAEIICPLDLHIAKCRLITAAPPGFAVNSTDAITVASKYPNLTRTHFAGRGIAVDIIKLNGALELAPLVGVADMIADLTDSGRTLRENGLVEQETIMSISAMLIINRIAARRQPAVRALQDDFAAACA